MQENVDDKVYMINDAEMPTGDDGKTLAFIARDDARTFAEENGMLKQNICPIPRGCMGGWSQIVSLKEARAFMKAHAGNAVSTGLIHSFAPAGMSGA